MRSTGFPVDRGIYSEAASRALRIKEMRLRALVLTSNRLLGLLCRQHLVQSLHYKKVLNVDTINLARDLLSKDPNCLAVIDMMAKDGDTLDFIYEHCLSHHRTQNIIALVNGPQAHVLSVLGSVGVRSVVDVTNCDFEQFNRSVEAMIEGKSSWSANLVNHLSVFKKSNDALLLPSERYLLAIIGDGSDDSDASQVLGLSHFTIRSLRRNLHKKLHIKHRGELIRYAALHGFVRLTGTEISRPGVKVLQDSYRPRQNTRIR